MIITGLIIAITCAISIIIFNKTELKYKYTFSPYQLKHENEWYRSFSHMFLHADWMHLIFNMFVLYNFGGATNDLLVQQFGVIGNLYFVLLYIGGGLFATVPSMFKHKDNSMYQSLGASGAVFSVLFGFILMAPEQRMGFIFLPAMPGYIFGPVLLAIEFFLNKRRESNIAHDAHIGGAVFGIVFLCILNYKFAVHFYESIVRSITG